MTADEIELKVRIYLNSLSNGKIEITCLQPILGVAAHARPYNSEGDALNVLLALGIGQDEADAFLATLRGREPMNRLEIGEYSVSRETLAAARFTAV